MNIPLWYGDYGEPCVSHKNSHTTTQCESPQQWWLILIIQLDTAIINSLVET